ncbi:MAG: metal-dependent transcriptional regulator [Clostridia bacterium]|jgi:Mn-dependent DtxR family transcriptional regulator|nr:metal-dependent transcriptional regulator [Clostridia bacterium]MBT7121459.1 metal-dependent transcriptional regulator [Clostridia bacterium]
MKYNESREMYLETIYLLEREAQHAHTADIAKLLGVSKPSVTKAMGLLKEQGLIEQERYGPVILTAQGREVSEKIYENHKLITQFIISSLELSPKQAEEDACKIEHIISQQMLSAMKAYLDK